MRLADWRPTKVFFLISYTFYKVNNSFPFYLDFQGLTCTATRIVCSQIPVKRFAPVTHGSLYIW